MNKVELIQLKIIWYPPLCFLLLPLYRTMKIFKDLPILLVTESKQHNIFLQYFLCVVTLFRLCPYMLMPEQNDGSKHQ